MFRGGTLGGMEEIKEPHWMEGKKESIAMIIMGRFINHCQDLSTGTPQIWLASHLIILKG